MTKQSPNIYGIFGRATVALAVTLISVAALATPAQAQDSPWSVGFQSSWPVYGLSARYDLNEKLVAQGVVGAASGLLSVSGRANYRFQQAEKYDVFGYAALTLWNWNGNNTFASETTLGFGAGGGIEVDWPTILEDDEFPPLYSTFEIGFGVAGFDNYDLSAFSFGASLHYRL